MARTAQGGLIEIDSNGNRRVTNQARMQFKKLNTPHKIMVVVHAHLVRRVHNGYQLNFRVIDQAGRESSSNLFIGDKNQMAKHHARMLRCTEAQLRDVKVLQNRLNRLVGRCMNYSHHQQWLRPIQQSPVVRLDRYLERCAEYAE